MSNWRQEALRRIANSAVYREYKNIADTFIREALTKASAENELIPASHPIRRKEPWKALAFKLCVAECFASGRVEGSSAPELDENVRLMVEFLLDDCQTYLWTTEILRAVRTSPPHPPVILHRPLFPFPSCFFCYEITMTDKEQRYGADFVTVEETEAGLTITTLLGPSTRWINENPGDPLGKPLPSGKVYRWGTRYDDKNDELGNVLKMAAFLRSKFVVCTEVSTPRAILRRTDAVKDDGLDFGRVAVVSLRAAAEQPPVGHGRDEPIKWKHRWWVAGHFREQYHPSTQRHEWAWIAPYVKGPQGMPFLEKVYSVRR